jgi:hypothetical protein
MMKIILKMMLVKLKQAFLKLIQRQKPPPDVYILICLFFQLLFLIKNAGFSINLL